jgi:hypothetical protein
MDGGRLDYPGNPKSPINTVRTFSIFVRRFVLGGFATA